MPIILTEEKEKEEGKDEEGKKTKRREGGKTCACTKTHIHADGENE